MTIASAAKEILEFAEGIEDLEINLNGGVADIYWQNLRLTLEPMELQQGLAAIKKLHKLGATFG